MKAVILAAGKGERLQPLTTNRPKHLIPVGGRPLLEWLLRRVAETGIRDVLIVTHYMDAKIKEMFRNGSDLGLSISYTTQKKMNGTADAFRFAEKFTKDEEFLGVYGDLFLSSGTLKEVIANSASGNLIISGLERDPYIYGALKLDGGNVLGIVEKPALGAAPSNITNAGIYVFPPAIFDHIKKIPISPRGEYEVTDAINSLIASGVQARLHMLDGDDWIDVGHPWSLLEANTRALRSIEPDIQGFVEESAKIMGSVFLAPTARIRSGAYIEGPVYIGDKSDVGPNCYIRAGTSLIANNHVGASCEIKNTILMDGAKVPHLSYVGDSIIGERCNLGAGTITANLRFDKKSVKMNIKDQVIDTKFKKLGVVMGDDCQTGINVSFHPGIKVGNGVWIAPGVTVSRDVRDGVLLTLDGEHPKPKAN